jgi:hypothetical protein
VGTALQHACALRSAMLQQSHLKSSSLLQDWVNRLWRVVIASEANSVLHTGYFYRVST